MSPHSPPTLLIYDSPDRVLEASRVVHSIPLPPCELHAGYSTLLGLSAAHILISGWSLECIPAQRLSAVLADPPMSFSTVDANNPVPHTFTWPQLEPLTAAIVDAVIKQEPGCLRSYLKLEVLAKKAGQSPDINYMERVSQAMDPTALLDHWWLLESVSLKLVALQLRQLQDDYEGLQVACQRLHNRHQFVHVLIGKSLDLFQRQLALLFRGISR